MILRQCFDSTLQIFWKDAIIVDRVFSHVIKEKIQYLWVYFRVQLFFPLQQISRSSRTVLYSSLKIHRRGTIRRFNSRS